MPEVSEVRTGRTSRPVRWLALGLLLLVSAGLAYLSGVSAFANALREFNPPLVARAADDPLARVLALQLELTENPERLVQPDVGQVARDSLRAQGLNVVALRTLALHAQARRDPDKSEAFAELAARLTRRDLFVQVMLIEQAVAANATAQALHHYDIALRTRSQAEMVLFPILNAALETPDIRAAVVPYVRGQTPWLLSFVNFGINQGGDNTRRLGELLALAGAGRRADLMEPSGAALLGELAKHGHFELARRLTLQMPSADAALLANASFTGRTIDPDYGPFSWTGLNTGSVGAAFEPDGDAGRKARLFAMPGERGVALKRVLALAPGAYRLTEARTRLQGDPGARAVWELSCVGAEQPIWRGPEQPIAYRLSGVPGPTIPASCRFQELELHISAGAGDEAMELMVDRFELAPAAGR